MICGLWESESCWSNDCLTFETNWHQAWPIRAQAPPTGHGLRAALTHFPVKDVTHCNAGAPPNTPAQQVHECVRIHTSSHYTTTDIISLTSLVSLKPQTNYSRYTVLDIIYTGAEKPELGITSAKVCSAWTGHALILYPTMQCI